MGVRAMAIGAFQNNESGRTLPLLLPIWTGDLFVLGSAQGRAPWQITMP